MLGCALVLASVFTLIRYKKRRREESGEKPPQREKLLRPAGYSAQLKIEALQERWNWAVAQAVGSGIVFGAILGGLAPVLKGVALGEFTAAQIGASPGSHVMIALVLIGIIALLWVIRALQSMWKLDDELRCWRLGMVGEQAVGQELASLEVAAAGYVAFHDVPGDGDWNIDHVVVGPAGVFVLETKARTRRIAKRNQRPHEVLFDGHALTFPWCEDRNAAEQVQRNAQWIRDFLNDFAPKDLPIQPIIVLPGWFVREEGDCFVRAMNAAYLVGYLARAQRLYEPASLKTIVCRLQERCRTVEF